MLQCYALFWLCFSTVVFQAFMKQTSRTDQEDDTAQDELESLLKFFSGRTVIRQFLIISLLIYSFDIAGMLLVYGYAELRPWQLILFGLVAAAILIDALLDYRKLRELVRTNSDDDLMNRLKQYMDPDTNPFGATVGAIAAGGKVVLAVLLVLWTVFP